LALFSKTTVMVKILHDLALFWFKNAIFRWIFRRNYLKNRNIGPRFFLFPQWMKLNYSSKINWLFLQLLESKILCKHAGVSLIQINT
jgi:hypothetical protein